MMIFTIMIAVVLLGFLIDLDWPIIGVAIVVISIIAIIDIVKERNFKKLVKKLEAKRRDLGIIPKVEPKKTTTISPIVQYDNSNIISLAEFKKKKFY